MPSLTSRTKTVLLSFFVIVVIAIIGKLVISHLYPTDLKSQLAKMLDVNPQALWINLPPAKNRSPGAVFIYQSTLLALENVQSDPDDLSVGTEFDLGWVTSTGSRTNANVGTGFLGAIYDGSEHVKIKLKASKCRSIEMPLNKLKQRLLKSEEVKAQAALGREPLIVVRAYEAMLTLRVSKTSETSAEGWTKIRRSTVAAASLPESKVAVSGDQDDTLEITLKEPVIFAYEMVAARLIATHLGTEPNDVQFTPILEPVSSAAAPKVTTPVSSTDPRRWALATAAVSHFSKTAWLQQEWNTHSADAVQSDLAKFVPTVSTHFRTAPDQLSSADAILRFAESVGEKARASDAKMLVFYYVGHALTAPDGHVYLLQSGITPQALKDLTKAASSSATAKPGRGLPALAVPVDIAPSTALRLADLHASLSKSKIPFTILLDGCMQNDMVKHAIESAGFRYDPQHPTLYYVGPEPLSQRFIGSIGSSLHKFGQQWAYLGASNPIVFSAKPGTLAMIGEDPNWQFGLPMAPLAQKLQRLLGPWASSKPHSLANLLTSMVDFRQGVGELELTGSVSWSDFSVIERLGGTITLGDERLPFSSASDAVVKEYQPNVGRIENFYFSEQEDRFYVISEGNNWRFWIWKPHGSKTLISSDLRFPKVSGTSNGHAYLHHDQDKTLAVVQANGRIKTIRTNLDVERMAPGRNPNELLVLGEASTVEESVPVWILQNNELSQIDHFRSSGVISASFDDSQRLIYIRENRDGIYMRDRGRDDVLDKNIAKPEALVHSGMQLFCIAQGKTRIYKITRAGMEQAELLREDGTQLIASQENVRGFQGTSKGNLLLINGTSIVELNPNALRWWPK